MTSEDLKRRLVAEGFDSHFYSLAGSALPVEGFILERDGTAWKIDYFERGMRRELASFMNEAEACEKMYEPRDGTQMKRTVEVSLRGARAGEPTKRPAIEPGQCPSRSFASHGNSRPLATALALAIGLAPGLAFGQASEPAEEEGFHVAEDPDAVAAQAAATEPGPETLQRAREAFLEGRRLMGEQQWGEAAASFEIALRARPTPGLHYHLGVCLERKGDLLEARRAYLAAHQLLVKEPAADVAVLLPVAIERIEGKLSRFKMLLSPDSALTWLDGVKLAAPYPEWLAPGQHALRAEAEGHEALHLRFEAQGGTPTRIEATLRPLPVVPTAAVVPVAVTEHDPSDESDGDPRSPVPRAVFWGSVTFGALGLAAGAAGTIWHVNASSQVAAAQDTLGSTGDSACYGPTAEVSQTCQDLRAAVAAEESAAILLVGGFVAAGLGALGAVTSWAVWPDEKFAVSGRAGFGSARLELSGRF